MLQICYYAHDSCECKLLEKKDLMRQICCDRKKRDEVVGIRVRS